MFNSGNAIDILILSNGPGEVTTWVRPVVQALRQQLGEDRDRVRISLVLSPCPNASGREVAIAQTYVGLDRIQAADHFLAFLLLGKTEQHWDWHPQGVVLFLGGDQFYAVAIAKWLGYRTVIYGEWETRWHRWVDRFGVMKPELIDRVSPKYAAKFSVVGDLMAEVERREFPPASLHSSEQMTDLIVQIGLLPGSKPAKLAQGLPLSLAIAEAIQAQLPQARFGIPVAPTLDLTALLRFANPQENPVSEQFGGIAGELVMRGDRPLLKTSGGVSIELWTEFPAHARLAECALCFTTVGANTAELGALAVPMIVLLPTQQLDAMRAWDGLPGLLANLPGIGSLFAKLINGWFLRKSRLLAWPNIWAGRAIVPELVGRLEAQQVAEVALTLLKHPERLEQMRAQLRAVRGPAGAAQKLAALVREVTYQ